MRADSRLGVEEDHRVSGEGRVGRCLWGGADADMLGTRSGEPGSGSSRIRPFGAHRIGIGSGGQKFFPGPDPNSKSRAESQA